MKTITVLEALKLEASDATGWQDIYTDRVEVEDKGLFIELKAEGEGLLRVSKVEILALADVIKEQL